MKNKNLSGNLFTKAALRQSEASLSKAVEEYLDRKNIFHLRLNSGKIRVVHPNGQTSWINLCPAGTPDRFFIYKAFHCFLELKKTGEKPTPEQLAKHDAIRKAGGYVTTVYRLDDVIDLVKWIDEQVKQVKKI
jgi:hypothetical protein